MTEETCIDSEIGKMLHAYELGALPIEECERFEAHLMECKACFAEAQGFCAESNLLMSDKSIMDEVSAAIGGEEVITGKSIIFKELKRLLWPDTLFVLKPAIALIIIALLIYPAYIGIRSNPEEGIRAVSAISLMPTRSSVMPEFEIPEAGDIIMSFMYRDAVPEHEYTLEITDKNGGILISDKSFTAFDKYGMGWLLIPTDKIKAGEYQLKLFDPDGLSTTETQIYEFRFMK
ncbi:MAG: zf-HC2 domain-containing protein [Candidatus Zixiibacteriota bacterium]